MRTIWPVVFGYISGGFAVAAYFSIAFDLMPRVAAVLLLLPSLSFFIIGVEKSA